MRRALIVLLLAGGAGCELPPKKGSIDRTEDRLLDLEAEQERQERLDRQRSGDYLGCFLGRFWNETAAPRCA